MVCLKLQGLKHFIFIHKAYITNIETLSLSPTHTHSPFEVDQAAEQKSNILDHSH